MCIFISLIPATILTTIGYFVLFSSAKAERAVSKFGKILAIWIFIVALIPIIMGIYLTISGLCPCEEMFKPMHDCMHP